MIFKGTCTSRDTEGTCNNYTYIMQYDYDVYVNYSVDGKEYTGKSDYYSGSYKEGMEIKISYDPNDPTKIHGDSKGMGIILMIAGSVTIVVCVVLLIAAGMVKRN